MRIGRTLPPAATPIGIRELISGLRGLLSGQPELDRFQSELKDHFGVKHCFLVSSGKAALFLILRARRELAPDRDEVLIPAFTCYSVPSSIVRAGLRIRLCDLQRESFDFDFVQLATILSDAGGASLHPNRGASDFAAANRATSYDSGASKKLLAIIPTHLFGYPADVAKARQLTGDPAVAIVEDAAQAMGEAGEGGTLGTLGDASFFSLGRGKAFSVVEGGIVLTNRDDIARGLSESIGHLPGYGLLALLGLFVRALALMLLLHPRLFWLPRSIPFLRLGETLFDPHFPIRRMSPFQAGLARDWQDRLETLRGIRKNKVTRWMATLECSRLHGALFPGSQGLELLRLPLRIGDANARESILRESTAKGLGMMPVYPTSINAIPELKGKLETAEYPVAESRAREVVTLPTHGYVTEHDVSVLHGLILRALRSSTNS
jgi:dTDP-4-amino-4,6-dideoxygalactose transaminase